MIDVHPKGRFKLNVGYKRKLAKTLERGTDKITVN
jgi:hypothetical protein